ncbi:MAG: hypothetical protein L0Z55_07260, partial [Planctomycetes bacterium]|nr:hypothetical protein [Planctomycetota bacterium]
MTAGDGSTTTPREHGAWRAFLRVLAFARPHWRRIVFAVVLMAVYAGASSIRVGMVGLLFDGVIVPADPAAGPGKVLGFYRAYVEPFVPLPLELR